MLIIVFLVSGCSHTLNLSYDSYDTNLRDDCLFTVKDLRPDPSHLYAKGSYFLRIKIKPNLDYAIQSAVCSKDPIIANKRNIVFFITDFECIVTGFFKLTYVADIRGRLVFPDGDAYEVRANNIIDTGIGYVPSGCELATAPLVRDVSEKIVNQILSYPNNLLQRTQENLRR